MTPVLRQLCLLVLAVCMSGSAGAADAQSPEQFLLRLYAAYGPNGKGNLFAYPQAQAIVDAALLALLRRDARLSHGEVGALDGDPVCQCQDWGPFKVLTLTAQSAGPDRARGSVTFENGPGKTTSTVNFALVRENGSWKIHDLSWPGTPSFRDYLINYKY